MALVTKAVRGTKDVLPSEIHKYQFIEQTVIEIAENFGYKEMRTPVFEHTELFKRSVGETTDVVQKEMYTFSDNGGRSITLRPEGTAGIVRAFLENGLFNEPLPQKISYITSCYRYEKPQAGRLREFHQFGIECFGTAAPAADAEVIALAHTVFNFLDVDNLSLEINSIGCPECRKHYHKALNEYFDSQKQELCSTCLNRLERNPMRILDCKSPVCSEIAKKAPVVLDFICKDCAEHFEGVKAYLNALNIEYKVNPSIVRGLDYYTRTVFEFVSTEIGAQGTVCGGGRYDGLIEELGGSSLPACGFGMGIERLILLMEAQNTQLPKSEPCNIYIASTDDKTSLTTAQLASDLRTEGISAQFDISKRSLKAQMKYADKIGALYTVVLGSEEISSNTVKVKDMKDGSTMELGLSNFAEDFMQMVIDKSLEQFNEYLDNDISKAGFTLLEGGKK